jgi:hypothetical protein
VTKGSNSIPKERTALTSMSVCQEKEIAASRTASTKKVMFYNSHSNNIFFRNSGTYSCSCNENFELSSDGYRCRSTPEGFCSQNPCHNSGKCVIDEHSFHCECEKGFTGRLCHHHIQLELPDYLNIHSEDQKGSKNTYPPAWC